MQTWSAVQKFNIEKKFRPVELSKRRYYKSMGGISKEKLVIWEINLRVGIIQ